MPDTTADLEHDLERAERAADALSREWGDHDADYSTHLRAALWSHANVDPDLRKERWRLWMKRGNAAYRIAKLEFMLGRTSVEPRHPDDGGVSPFNTQPFGAKP